MLRILFITRKFPPQVGGMENLSFNLLTYFKRRADCQVQTIILKRSQYHLLWWFPYATFLAAIKARHADVVHLGDPVLAWIGFFVKFFYRKPVAVTVHGLDVTFPSLIYQWYLKFFGRRFDAYLCISRYAQAEAQRRALGPCRVITIGVDFRKAQAAQKISAAEQERWKKKLGIAPGKHLLLTVGRLVPRKGVYWFIDAVLPLLPPQDLYLVVGEGEERARIEKLITHKNLSCRVKLLGRIADQELLTTYRLAHIFIMPNIKVPGDMEGFGLTAVEAALNGLPVIATGIEGIRDAIADGQNGILVPEGQPAAFVREIGRMFQEEKRRLAFGRKAQAYTRKYYDWRVIIDKYFLAFSEISKKDLQI